MHTKIVQTFIQPHLLVVGYWSGFFPAPVLSLSVSSGLLYPALVHLWDAGGPDVPPALVSSGSLGSTMAGEGTGV